MSRQFMQVVDGPLIVRAEPGVAARRLGELVTGRIIEIVPGVSATTDGFVWVQHQFGWSAERGLEEQTVFMQSVPESLAINDSTAVLLAPLAATADGVQTELTYLQVVTDALTVRAEPRTSAARVAELPHGIVLAVDPSSRTLADGFIWWRHGQGWSAASTDAGTEIYLEPLVTAPVNPPAESESAPVVVEPPPVELPDLADALAASRYFKVVMGPVTVREKPDVNSRKLGEIPNGVIVEVVPGSRFVNGDYVYWQHSGGWSAEGRADGGQQFMIPATEPDPKVEVPAPDHPTITPEEIRFLKVVDGPVSIRALPDPTSQKLGEIPNDTVVEVEKGSRVVASGYIYYRHSRGWSAMGTEAGGSPFMIPVAVMMPDVIVTLPQVPLGVFQVIDGPISIRAPPDVGSEKLGELPNLVTVEIDKFSMTDRDGFIWWRHHLGWSVERKSDSSGVFMLRVPVMLNPPLPQPGTWPDGTPVRFFEVVDGPISIRKEPDSSADRVGTLFNKEQIEVDPATRMVLKGLVWWRHAQGWSVERPVTGTQTFMQPIRELTQAPSTGGFNPFPIFTRHPVPLNDTQWIQYFGNTRFAYNLRVQKKFWYNYCQGLHGGFDYGCNRAVPVFAGVDGQIIDVKYNTSTYAPNFTRVRVGPFMVIYGHIAVPSSFNVGDVVTPETVIGVIDAGGQNHLHLEVRYKNQIVNPLRVMPPEMQREITSRWKDLNKHFYSDSLWNQWLSPLDQPVLDLQLKGQEVIIGPHG